MAKRKMNQSGELFMREGVRYTVFDVPPTTHCLYRGRLLDRVSSVCRTGDIVIVEQFDRLFNGVRRLALDASKVRLKVHRPALCKPDQDHRLTLEVAKFLDRMPEDHARYW